MADEKKKGLGLPQTNGSFQLSGITTGTEKDSFYKETLTKTKKPWRMINFGVKTDKDTTIYLNLNGGEKEEVYFSKSTTVDGKNTINYIPPIKIANSALILADEMIKQLKESEEKK